MSAQDIVDAAEQFALTGKVFAKGCSDMVRQAYAAGGVTIPVTYDANAIISGYQCVAAPQPGDIAGWPAGPKHTHGHVVIFVDSRRFVNCPGEGEATKINSSMGSDPLTYVRPT